jgi:hypothetical protein
VDPRDPLRADPPGLVVLTPAQALARMTAGETLLVCLARGWTRARIAFRPINPAFALRLEVDTGLPAPIDWMRYDIDLIHFLELPWRAKSADGVPLPLTACTEGLWIEIEHQDHSPWYPCTEVEA